MFVAVGGGRRRPRVAIAGRFLLGAVLGAGTLYLLVGAFGYLVPEIVGRAVAVAAAAYSLQWYVRGRDSFRWSRLSFQANKEWIRRRHGMQYFGAILGIAVFTEMSTPLVWSGLPLAATLRLPLSLVYGAGFALGRSMPALAGVFLHPEVDGARASAWVIDGVPRLRRALGVVTALAAAALALGR